MSGGLHYLLLGPVEVVAGGRRVPINRPRQRAVLAYLLLHANQLVTTDALVDAVWGGSEPGTARTQVQTDLSIVRRALRAADLRDPVTTRPSGYVITCEPGQVDLDEFGRRSQHALAMTDPELAIAELRGALGLWRGQALADVNAAYAESVRVSLEQRRLYAYERLYALELDCGRAADVIAELTALVDAHPTHERLVGQLMLALYRSGRQAEALKVARSLRGTLADELGIDPGPELRELEQSILRNDPVLAGPTESPRTRRTSGVSTPAPAQLPPDIAGFVGRADDRARLDALIPDASTTSPATASSVTASSVTISPATTSVVAAIFGPAGVGKTALAVHWGHSVSDRFPDGQLYVDLRGYSTDPPVTPAEALTRFLRALGVPPDQLPHDLDDLTAAYRTRLAGRRLLVVADNASHVDQVRPLLPAAPGCLCLVTSRTQFGGLVAVNSARPVILDALHQSDAEALLVQIIGAERAAAEPDAVVELAAACDHLPLALRIAAAHLALNPHQRVAELVGRMRPGDRLAALSIAGDRQASVRTAFDNSYGSLAAGPRDTFRALGLVPGVDISVAGVAALTGTDDAAARTAMSRLAATHLVDPRAEDRFAMHDLMREYAALMASTEDSEADRDAAIDRLLAWQVRNADVANSMVSEPHVRMDIPPELTARLLEFDNRAQALNWLNDERENLVSSIRFAAETGRGPIAWLLVDRLRGYFRRGGHFTEWLEVGGLAADVARRVPDEVGARAEAITRFGLGLACQTLGRSADAVAHYTASSAAARRAGWVEVEAGAIGGTGSVALHDGQLTEASARLRRAVELARECGATALEANSLGNLAVVTVLMGQIVEAQTMLEAVGPLFRKAGVARGEAQAANNLSDLYRIVGRLDDAAEAGQRAVAVFEEIGDASRASALANLALIRSAQARGDEALELALRARKVADETGHRYYESDCDMILGTVYRRLGQLDTAIRYAERSLAMALELDSSTLIVLARTVLSEVLLAAGQFGRARTEALDALALARTRSMRADEVTIRVVLAEIELAAGAPEAAVEHAAEVIADASAMGLHPLLERAEAVQRAAHVR
jgi:DNA-binding SARP family transcriptional activator